MSVQEIILQLDKLSHEELIELNFELEKTQLIRASHKVAKRWAGVKIELRSPVRLQEPQNSLELQEKQMVVLEAFYAARPAELNTFVAFSEPLPKYAEIWSPWNELEAAKDAESLLAEGKL